MTKQRAPKRRYQDALTPQREARRAADLVVLEARYRAGEVFVEPHRITLALNAQGMYGPGVDHACKAEEPAVDQWEAGEAVPSWEQLRALSVLTTYPVQFFFLPPQEDLGPVWLCGDDPCQVVVPAPPVRPAGHVPPLVLTVVR